MPESHSPRMIEQSRCPKCEILMMLVGVEPSFAGPICARLNVQSANWPTRRWQRTNETENKAGWPKSELSPMRVFTLGVEHARDVTVQCPQQPDPSRTKKPRRASTGSSSGEGGTRSPTCRQMDHATIRASYGRQSEHYWPSLRRPTCHIGPCPNVAPICATRPRSAGGTPTR